MNATPTKRKAKNTTGFSLDLFCMGIEFEPIGSDYRKGR